MMTSGFLGQNGNMAEESSQVGGAMGGRLSDSSFSITDITLEQAVIKLQEIDRENIALRDNLRENNAIVKKQYEALSEWRKKENEKFEQTKALITALRAENQEFQVKVMTMKDKETEMLQRVKAIEEEKAHLLRKKAINDQRVFNVFKLAEQQGVKGIVYEENEDDETNPEGMVFVSTSEKEEQIAQLEASVASKDDAIAQLRADILAKDQEVAKFRESTKQLLKDMESQQKLKESIEEENRALTKSIMEQDEKFHREMQSVMAMNKRHLQNEQMSSAAALTLTTNTPTMARMATAGASALAGAGGPAEKHDHDVLSFPENMDDLRGIAKSLEAKHEEEASKELLKKTLEDEKKAKKALEEEKDRLLSQINELKEENERTQQRLEEAQLETTETANQLTQQYEEKLIELTKQNKGANQSYHPSKTEDLAMLRSQVLTLIQENDDCQSKLSAALAALQSKDARIMELEHMRQNQTEQFNQHWQETHSLIQNLRLQLNEQQKAQEENRYIKTQHQKLQDSFSKLVTDYKELQETFETYRQQMERQAAAPKQASKDIMEEINRLAAQVIAADEAISYRDEQIAKLKQQHRPDEDEVQLLRIQAEVYQNDFRAERESRTKLAEEKDKLMEDMQALRERNQQLVEEIDSHNRREMSNMQQRHRAAHPSFEVSNHLRATPPLAQDYQQDYRQEYRHDFRQDYRQATPPAWGNRGQNNPPSVGSRPPEEDEDQMASFQQYTCPSCNAQFPDIDSLQLHVPDCIQ